MGSTARIRRDQPNLAFSNGELRRHAEALAPLPDSVATGQKRQEPADRYLTARKRIFGRDRRASA